MSQSGLTLLGLFAVVGASAVIQLVHAVNLAPNMNEDFDPFWPASEDLAHTSAGAAAAAK